MLLPNVRAVECSAAPSLSVFTAKQLTATPRTCLGFSPLPLPSPPSFFFNQPLLEIIAAHTHRQILNINTIGLATMDTCQQSATRSALNEEHHVQALNFRQRAEASEQSIDAQNETHAPSNDKASQDGTPQRNNPQSDTRQDNASHADASNFKDWRPPVASYSLLRILPTVEIHANSTLLIRNPRENGPQTDICARIPGYLNHWAARISCNDSLYDFHDWVVGNSGEESPEVWMYVSTNPDTFININDIHLLSLYESVSIVALTNPGHPLPSGWTKVTSGWLSVCPLLPGLRDVLGPEGAKWLV
jgi:hypothetical protein